MENFIVALIFVVTVGSAVIVAFSRNLIYSAFALIGSFLGVAATFILLSADFVGLTQVMVYVGGILVLTIFAVMLTARIQDTKSSNPLLSRTTGIAALVLLEAPLLYFIFTARPWVVSDNVGHETTITEIGNSLLGQYLLPFELISVLLLMSMVGAAIISRRQVKGGEQS